MDPKTSQKGSTALTFAAQEGHKEIVEELVRAKAEVNLATNEGSGLGGRLGKGEFGVRNL